MSEDTIKVCIRIRPFLETELISSNMSPIITNPDDDETIKVGKNSKFTEEKYDKVFFESSTQEDVFNYVNFCTKEAIQGINCSLITYGQTGSGKTYTMFGKEWTNNENMEKPGEIATDEYNFIYNEMLIDPFSESNGLIPRMLNNILTEISEKNFSVYCSFIQIYNEKIYDLLDVNSLVDKKEKKNFRVAGKNDFTTVNPISQRPLEIREDRHKGIYIDGLTQNPVENLYDCINYLKIGENLRKKRQTNKNELSSRSHTVFMMDLFSNERDENGGTVSSRIHFCDLAGSEKFDQNFKYNKIHFNEMRNINKSLCTLANVINALTNKSSFVPYRESKLTQILQNSLGGSSRTVIIATISPSIENYEETISTLQFAKRVTKVKVTIEPNKLFASVDQGTGNNKIIEKLTKEVSELKQLLKLRKKNGVITISDDNMNEIVRLRRENEQLRNELMKMSINKNPMSYNQYKGLNSEEEEFSNYTSSNKNIYSVDMEREANYTDKSKVSNSSKRTLQMAGEHILLPTKGKRTGYSTGSRIPRKGGISKYLENNSMLKMLKSIEKENDEMLKKEIAAIKNKKY
ncbi:MAG: kinesin family protein [archaeon]|nr:kinesin family protein [archaeon]